MPFLWIPITEEAFFTLKKALVEAPVLALPQFDKSFVIETDACDKGIGEVLMQEGTLWHMLIRLLAPRTEVC